MADRDYFLILDRNNTVRVRFKTVDGNVVDFVVQLETYIEGTYRPVVRYDGSHGRGHRDILDWNGNTIDKHWLPQHMDFNDCLTFARDDIRANWKRYLDRFLEQ